MTITPFPEGGRVEKLDSNLDLQNALLDCIQSHLVMGVHCFYFFRIRGFGSSYFRLFLVTRLSSNHDIRTSYFPPIASRAVQDYNKALAGRDPSSGFY